MDFACFHVSTSACWYGILFYSGSKECFQGYNQFAVASVKTTVNDLLSNWRLGVLKAEALQ